MVPLYIQVSYFPYYHRRHFHYRVLFKRMIEYYLVIIIILLNMVVRVWSLALTYYLHINPFFISFSRIFYMIVNLKAFKMNEPTTLFILLLCTTFSDDIFSCPQQRLPIKIFCDIGKQFLRVQHFSTSLGLWF